MSRPGTTNAYARAERLVRWYPKEWRARYGEEFTELLAAQVADQPPSWSRTLDVYIGAIMARSAALGLSGATVDLSDQPRRSLATLGCAIAVFLMFALSMWSQLTIASKSAAPTTTATHTALIIMTLAVAITVTAVAAASIPFIWTATRAAWTDEFRMRAPIAMLLAGTAVLIIGGLAFHHGWSTTSHPWTQSTGPGGPASFIWISTLTVSAYWAHPSILLALPPSEIAWMVISPIALLVSVAGAAKAARTLRPSLRFLRFITRTAQMAIAGLGLFVFGTLTWLLDGGPGPAHRFQAGNLDKLGLFVMTATLITAIQSIQRTTRPQATAR